MERLGNGGQLPKTQIHHKLIKYLEPLHVNVMLSGDPLPLAFTDLVSNLYSLIEYGWLSEELARLHFKRQYTLHVLGKI